MKSVFAFVLPFLSLCASLCSKEANHSRVVRVGMGSGLQAGFVDITPCGEDGRAFQLTCTGFKPNQSFCLINCDSSELQKSKAALLSAVKVCYVDEKGCYSTLIYTGYSKVKCLFGGYHSIIFSSDDGQVYFEFPWGKKL